MKEHVSFEKMSDYIDNLLDDEEKKIVMAHISSCDKCRDEFNRLKKMMSLLSSMKSEGVKDSDLFVASTMKRVERNHLFRRKFMWPTAAAAVIGFVVLSGIMDMYKNVPEVTNGIAQEKVYDRFTLSGDARDIINDLQTSGVRVVKVSGNKILAEAKFRDYSRVRYGIYPTMMSSSGMLLVGGSGERIRRGDDRVVRFLIEIR